MGNIFNLDSTFMKYANKFADLMILNIITIVLCIPIFTIGAAMTAMHSMVLKIYRDEESYVFKGYFKAFKDNFKQSTIIWLFYMVLILVIALDFYYIRDYDLGIPKFIQYALIFISILGSFSLVWVFILQSRYENKVINTLKNSLIVGGSRFLYSIMMIALAIMPLVAMAFFPIAYPLSFAFGLTVPALLQAMLYSKVLDRIEGVDRKALKAEQQVDDGWTLEEIEEDSPEVTESVDAVETIENGQVDEEKAN